MPAPAPLSPHTSLLLRGLHCALCLRRTPPTQLSPCGFPPIIQVPPAPLSTPQGLLRPLWSSCLTFPTEAGLTCTQRTLPASLQLSGSHGAGAASEGPGEGGGGPRRCKSCWVSGVREGRAPHPEPPLQVNTGAQNKNSPPGGPPYPQLHPPLGIHQPLSCLQTMIFS